MNEKYIPSAALLEKINKLDVRVYGTLSGQLYIGEVSEVFENAIELAYPAILKLKDSHDVCFTEAIPGNSYQPIALYSSQIELESHASLLLKKLYCDYLTASRLNQIAKEEFSSDPTVICHLEPKGLSDDYLKRIARRLKP